MYTRLSTSSLPLWTPTITLLTCWYSAPSSDSSAPGSMKGSKCDLDFDGVWERRVSVRIVICQYVHTVEQSGNNVSIRHAALPFWHTQMLTVSCLWMGFRQCKKQQMESYCLVNSSENFWELFSWFNMCSASTIPCPWVSPPPVFTSSSSLQEREIVDLN